MLRRIVPYGDPVLRQVAQNVLSIDGKIQALVDDMVETVKAAGGLGLAAPQVGESVQLFIIDWSIIEEDKGIEVYINPIILSAGYEKEVMSEGCLSLPGVEVEISRPSAIEVEYTNLKGKREKRSLTGLPSRAFQHELDHLNGVLIIDRLEPNERKKIQAILKEILEGKLVPFDPEKPETHPQKEKIISR